MRLPFHVPQSTWLHCEFSHSRVPRHVCGTLSLAVCGVPVPRHWQWWVQGWPLWGEPRAAPSQTQTAPAAPVHPSQGIESHGGAPLGKRTAQQWGVREIALSHPGERRKKGRRCSSSRVDIPLQPMAKIVVRQPVLWQTGESMQEQVPGWACGEEPMQEHIVSQVSDPREDPQCNTLVPKDCTETGKIHKRLYPVDGTPLWSRETEWERSGKVLQADHNSHSVFPCATGVGRWKNQESSWAWEEGKCG